MIPIENSIAGRVADIHALLPASGLHIVGETFLPIHFQLLAVPGARIEDLRTVYSHVHALGQCRNIIRRHRLKPIVASDTAGSAREVAEWADKTRASLATRLAGEIYGLADAGFRRRGRDAQHDPLRRAVEGPALGAGRRRAGGDDLRLPGAQRAGRALQGARRLRHQRRQHDQARELHGRAASSPPPSSSPTSTAIRTIRRSSARWRSSSSSPGRCAFSASIRPIRSAPRARRGHRRRARHGAGVKRKRRRREAGAAPERH